MALPDINALLKKQASGGIFGRNRPAFDWVNEFQNPYDQQMRELTDFSPEELALTQEYQNALALAGEDPRYSKVTSGAREGAAKYYPGYGFDDGMLDERFFPQQTSEASGEDPFQDQMGMTPLEAPPEVNPMFSQDIIDMFRGNQANQAQDILKYNQPAAQMDLSQIPNPEPKLLNEGGYDPSVLALMRGRATDDIAQAGAGELSQAKRALGQAGLGNSGAGAAFGADVARRAGDATSSANRDIDIQSADVGMANARTNIATVNQMALERASKLFAGLSQNTANQQASSMAGSNAAMGLFGNMGNEFNAQMLNRANSADFGNAANKQRTNELNFGAGEDRWRNALSALTSFSNPSFPQAPSNGGSFLGSTLGNVGSSFLDQAINQIDWGKPQQEQQIH